MGLISTTIRRKGSLIGNIKFDAVLSESASATARITKNPVESGTDFNDHIIIDPMTFNLTGIVSNASTSSFEALQNAKTLIQGKSKIEKVWNDLLKLHSSREPFLLYQGLKEYKDVVIQSLSESQEGADSNTLRFTAVLTQINIVGIEAPPKTEFSDKDTSDKATPSKNNGLKKVG
jgi:hypothetical protein